jgi:hypothetical protein
MRGKVALQQANTELLSNLVFKGLNQAAAWFESVTSIPSLNFTPVMTCARYSNPR